MVTTTIYHDKAKELGNLISNSSEYKRLIAAREAYVLDTEAKELDKKIEDYNNSLQVAIKMGALTTDDYRSAIAELASLERELKNSPTVLEFMSSEEEYNNLVTSVMAPLNKMLENMSKTTQGGPKMCSCGSNPDGPCFSSCSISSPSSKSSGGCGSGCSCV